MNRCHPLIAHALLLGACTASRPAKIAPEAPLAPVDAPAMQDAGARAPASGGVEVEAEIAERDAPAREVLPEPKRESAASRGPAPPSVRAAKSGPSSFLLTDDERRTVSDYDALLTSPPILKLHDAPCGDKVCSLRATLCDLAERVCIIANRHPEDEDLAMKCADGKNRCVAAGEAVARCGCQAR